MSAKNFKDRLLLANSKLKIVLGSFTEFKKGAIQLIDSSLELENVIFANNSSPDFGGALYS